MLEYCECRENPDSVRELIHERDAYANTHSIEARREERLLDIQISYVLGHYDDLEEAIWDELNWDPLTSR